MIAKIVKLIIVLPLAILLIAFVVANRHEVVISFDPIDTANPAFAIGLPLFVLVFTAVAIGVVLGWVAAWWTAGKARRDARKNAAEAQRWKAEAEKLTPQQPADRANALALRLPKPPQAA